jgi:DNA-binding NarL/FixJ family response regulator
MYPLCTSAPEQVRVVVVDDDKHFRRGLRAVLETDPRVTVVGEAGDADAAVQVATAATPDVVLLDVRMPGGGVEAVAALRAVLPETAVLMLTVSDDRVDMVHALQAGAAGYLLKDSRLHEVADAVCSAARGERWPPG